MLEEIRSRKKRRQVFRLTSPPKSDDFDDFDDFMAELQLDQQGGKELQDLLVDGGYGVDVDELLDGPFRSRRRLRHRTRFSDGSFPVFYSSLNPSTAEAEIRHWIPSIIGSPQNPRTAYYQRFSCTFDGIEKDLRPKVADWPYLVHDNDYSFCNQLGAEARRLEVDGLVTRSARCEGANLPVFARRAVSSPKLLGIVAMTYHPDTGQVTAVDI